MERKTDVIILGAGISGLSCARVLKEQHGLNVVVLEARDRVGGRTYTVRDPSFKYTDLGGAYVGPTQRRVARMAKELGLQFYKINMKERSIMDITGYRLLYYGTIPPILRPITALDLNHIQRTLDKMAKQVPPEAPWKAPEAERWDRMTFQEFIDKNCWTRYSAGLVAIIAKGLLCVEPCEVSLLFVLWYISSGQGFQRLVNIKNGAQERKFVGGAMQLSERMADRLGDGVVKLSHPVIKVQQLTNPDSVRVTCADGSTYEGSYVVSSVPLALLNRVTFDPPLPSLKLQLIQRVPMGSIIKTMMFYERPFWREKGLSGQMGCDKGPILYCMDDTKDDGSCACIMGFILANHARDMVDLTTEQRKQAIAKHYAAMFKCEEFAKPINYAEKNWMEEEYSGGCYVSSMPPGVITSFMRVIREPYGRVYFAGTECATYWAGYMEGAIESGERAAREVLHTMGKIPATDVWQDEPPSPEFPERGFPGETLEKVLPSVSSFLWFCGAVAGGVLAWLAHHHFELTLDAKFRN